MLFWIAGAAALGLVFALALVVFADNVLTRAINDSGHRFLNVETRVESCRLSLLNGSLSLRGIELKNPEGFKSPRMVYLEEISLSLALTSLFKDRIQIKDVRILGTELTYEIVGFGRSNLSVFMDGLRKQLHRNGPFLEKNEAERKRKSVVIDRLSVEGGRVTLSAVFSQGQGIVLALPPLELRDIGKDRPMSVSEAVSEVLRKLGHAALSTVDESGEKP